MPVSGDDKNAASWLLRRFVSVGAHEAGAAAASFTMFFALLSAYYIIRPVRDEMGVVVGKDDIHHLFTAVFFVMLLAVPLFGWIASRFPRRYVLPALYLFFTLNLVVFSLAMRAAPGDAAVAATFFVWASVFNLFVVSLFWSLMSEVWNNEEATRIYGFVSAGGTGGALAGPLITKALVAVFAPADLLLVSAALLVAATFASLLLRRLRAGHAGAEERAAGGGIFDGAVKVLEVPYLRRIALFVLLANVVGTFFYLEQSRLVAATLGDSSARVDFFATRDLMVSVATITVQVFITSRILQRFGLVAALAALPLAATISTVALGYESTLWLVAAAMVVERVVAFSLANPAIKVMYTLTAPDEKYKAQNFIDTVVYRGGDAAAGWLFTVVGQGVGFAAFAVPAFALPLCGLWIWNAIGMAQSYRARANM